MNSRAADTREQFHGGIDRAELDGLGKAPEEILDLSSNILAVQHPTSVRDALLNVTISSYPDRECTELRRRIAQRHLLDEERVVVGNGCCELIHLLAQSVLKGSSRTLVSEPTFSEYRRASELAGSEVETCFTRPGSASSDWATELSAKLDAWSFDLVWICNPNNPCGTSRDRSVIDDLARKHPATIFAVDESYIDFAESTRSIIHCELPNVVCLRSLTKSHALAGVRLGYVVADKQIIGLIKDHRPPWSTNAIAQAVGVAVLEAEDNYAEAISIARLNRKRLVGELRKRDLQPLESDTNFLLLPVDDAIAFREILLQRNILVRDCSSFGLERHVRIAVGNDAAIDRLLAAIDEPPGDESVPTRTPPSRTRLWGPEFRHQLHDLFRLRRDVRKFRSDAIPADCVQRWIDAACLAPSVGLSQPWRFISVQDPETRSKVSSEFEKQNALAASDYEGAERAHYLSMKLAGIREAPEQLAVFVESDPSKGRGLGRRTMPETVEYSVVAAIQNFWLAARAEGVGVGWVSILDSDRINDILKVPGNYQLIAYLCIGYPCEPTSDRPRLEVDGWEQRSAREQAWVTK